MTVAAKLFMNGCIYTVDAKQTAILGQADFFSMRLSEGHYSKTCLLNYTQMTFTAPGIIVLPSNLRVARALILRAVSLKIKAVTSSPAFLRILPYIGFMTGWIMLLDYLLLPMICHLFLGLFMNKYCPAVPIWTWIIISVVIVAIVNILGIEPTVTVNTLSVILQAAFSLLFLFVVTKLILGGGGTGTFFPLEAVYNAPQFDIDAFLTSVGTLIIAFLGFDAVTALAEETIEPKKNSGPDLTHGLPVCRNFFMVVSYFCQIAWPSGWREIVDPSTGFFEIAQRLNVDYIEPLYF